MAAAATSALEHSLGMTCDPVPWSALFALENPGSFCTCGKFFGRKISDFNFRSWAWCRRHASSAIPWVPPRRQRNVLFHGAWHAVFFFGASCVVGLSHTDYSYYSVITAKFFNDVYVIIVTVTACCVRVSS